MDSDKLLNLATSLGCLLAESGAEISRVEESVYRLLQAYQGKDAQVFAIPSCLIVSLMAEDGRPVTHRLSSHARLTRRDLHHFPDETLFHRVARVGLPQPAYEWQTLGCDKGIAREHKSNSHRQQPNDFGIGTNPDGQDHNGQNARGARK